MDDDEIAKLVGEKAFDEWVRGCSEAFTCTLSKHDQVACVDAFAFAWTKGSGFTPTVSLSDRWVGKLRQASKDRISFHERDALGRMLDRVAAHDLPFALSLPETDGEIPDPDIEF